MNLKKLFADLNLLSRPVSNRVNPSAQERTNTKMDERRERMTFKEKLQIEHPDEIGFDGRPKPCRCPDHFGYESFEDSVNACCGHLCTECWNREIPETKPIKNEREENKTMMPTVTIRKTKAELLEEIDALKKEVAALERYKTYEQAATDAYALLTSFVNAGFTREEAFQLIVTGIRGAGKR